MVRISKIVIWSTFVLGLTAVVIVAIAVRLIEPPTHFFTPGSHVVTYQDGSFAHVRLSEDERWRIATAIKDIDPDYIESLIRLEDKRFYQHGGVDLIALLRATYTNLRRAKVISGASTITMQLVRVREPRPRTITSKFVEILRAWQLEAHLSKNQILESYLQYIPFGKNIEGVEAASLSYFGHRANELSKEEICILLAVPQNPNKRYPSKKNHQRLQKAQLQIAKKLYPASSITPSAPSKLTPFPRHAMHAATWLLDQNPTEDIVHSTLDRGTQKQVVTLLRSYKNQLNHQGIFNAVIVAVEINNAAVRALVGNIDFWDKSHSGQFPGFLIARSTGSTLKSIIYALAIDEGKYMPRALVADLPVQYGTYIPKNYNGKFNGLVRLDVALAQSLNIPFVSILRDIKTSNFIYTLQSWGLESLSQQKGYYGLSAAIGAVELTALELTKLYTILANDGKLHDLRFLENTPLSPPIRALSPAAAYLTRQALRTKDRPDFPDRQFFNGLPPQVFWKTGTSYGHKDAWAIGGLGRYVVSVWLGNFDQRPSQKLIGAQSAGPILFDILEALEPDFIDRDTKPNDLEPITVCAYSGYPAHRGCPATKINYTRKDNVPTEVCPFHIELTIDNDSGLALNPLCEHHFPNRSTQKFLRPPPGLENYFTREARQLPLVPDLHPLCTGTIAKTAPTIQNPRTGQIVILVPGVSTSDQDIPLRAHSSEKKLAWFMDGAFLGYSNSTNEIWWTPTVGKHELVVSDQAGRTTQSHFEVRLGVATP